MTRADELQAIEAALAEGRVAVCPQAPANGIAISTWNPNPRRDNALNRDAPENWELRSQARDRSTFHRAKAQRFIEKAQIRRSKAARQALSSP
jgi:hypothetical protein